MNKIETNPVAPPEETGGDAVLGMSGRLPTVSGLDVAKVLSRDGFTPVRQKGSHLRLVKAGAGELLAVTVPGNQKDLKKGTLMGILQQAGLSKDEFLELLSA